MQLLTVKNTSQGTLPNLIIIGAMKCGTTSLHYYLNLHPQISMSQEKELKFFLRKKTGTEVLNGTSHTLQHRLKFMESHHRPIQNILFLKESQKECIHSFPMPN